MTKTKALKQARDEIRMYRDGPRRERQSWVVNSYDPNAKADRVSRRMYYEVARAVCAELRLGRVYELIGMEPLEVYERASYETHDYGKPQ